MSVACRIEIARGVRKGAVEVLHLCILALVLRIMLMSALCIELYPLLVLHLLILA